MNWTEKKEYIINLVEVKNTERTRSDGDSRRKNTFKYYFEINGEKFHVCKTMFVHTFDISAYQIQTWKMNALRRNERKNYKKQEKKTSSGRKIAKEFLDSLPRIPSHYCRQNTNRSYLYDEIKSKAELYKLFQGYCSEHQAIAPGRNVLIREFKSQNMSFFQPRKDRCDTCISYECGNIDQDVYEKHIQRKNAARNQKSNDKSDDDPCHEVWCMDVQAVLTCPKLNASALYYKTKLALHNFTMYNLKTAEVRCYVWNETEGDLSASSFATCIRHCLNDVITRNPNIKVITLYSDGCGYQNRNATLSNMLIDFATSNNITLQQKYLEKGHAQSEVDSVHSTIERKLKNRQIYWPHDYLSAMKECREKNPYQIIEMKHDDFFDFTAIKYIDSVRPGKKPGEPQVHDLRVLKYTEDRNVYFKTSYGDDFAQLPQRIKTPSDKFEFHKAHRDRLCIKKTKFQHLQQIKPVLPGLYHKFYDDLPH